MPASPDPSLLRGDHVRVVRESLGLTRIDLARLLDVSFDSVRSWEGNRRGTPPGVIEELQKLQDRQDEAAARAVESYMSLPGPGEGPAPVFTITRDDPYPVGWQRNVAARVAQRRTDLVVEDQARGED